MPDPSGRRSGKQQRPPGVDALVHVGRVHVVGGVAGGDPVIEQIDRRADGRHGVRDHVPLCQRQSGGPGLRRGGRRFCRLFGCGGALRRGGLRGRGRHGLHGRQRPQRQQGGGQQGGGMGRYGFHLRFPLCAQQRHSFTIEETARGLCRTASQRGRKKQPGNRLVSCFPAVWLTACSVPAGKSSPVRARGEERCKNSPSPPGGRTRCGSAF